MNKVGLYILLTLLVGLTACDIPTHSAKINITKIGAGRVTSNPSGINCGDACTYTFANTTTVILTATPDAGYRFVSWQGNGCFGTDPCTLQLLDAPANITATFEKDGSTTGVDTAPSVTISSPTNNLSVNGASLNVSGTASDDKGISKIEYSLNNGARQTLSGTGAFNFAVTLVQGSNTITVYATDTANQTSSQSVTVTYGNQSPNGDFSLSPSYPSGNTAYFIAQNAEALYKVKISRQNGFAALAQNFDSVTITGSVIGSGASKVYATFRKDLSSGDDLAFTLTGGAAAPVGSYTITLTATSGALTKTITANLNVTECSFGCN